MNLYFINGEIKHKGFVNGSLGYPPAIEKKVMFTKLLKCKDLEALTTKNISGLFVHYFQ